MAAKLLPSITLRLIQWSNKTQPGLGLERFGQTCLQAALHGYIFFLVSNRFALLTLMPSESL